MLIIRMPPQLDSEEELKHRELRRYLRLEEAWERLTKEGRQEEVKQTERLMDLSLQAQSSLRGYVGELP